MFASNERDDQDGMLEALLHIYYLTKFSLSLKIRTQQHRLSHHDAQVVNTILTYHTHSI